MSLARQFKPPAQMSNPPSTRSTTKSPLFPQKSLSDSIDEATQTQEYVAEEVNSSSEDESDSFEDRMIAEIRKQTKEFLADNGQAIITLTTRKHLREQDKKAAKETVKHNPKKRKIAP